MKQYSTFGSSFGHVGDQGVLPVARKQAALPPDPGFSSDMTRSLSSAFIPPRFPFPPTISFHSISTLRAAIPPYSLRLRLSRSWYLRDCRAVQWHTLRDNLTYRTVAYTT